MPVCLLNWNAYFDDDRKGLPTLVDFGSSPSAGDLVEFSNVKGRVCRVKHVVQENIGPHVGDCVWVTYTDLYIERP